METNRKTWTLLTDDLVLLAEIRRKAQDKLNSKKQISTNQTKQPTEDVIHDSNIWEQPLQTLEEPQTGAPERWMQGVSWHPLPFEK